MIKIKHLKDKKVGYWEHWWVAMSCSLALFVHAWIPCLFEDYASKKINKK
jgi:hypothetical protein|tara:strand:- start:618 stop:767 length:150 start_codon:yes stop_codon:yes gene_type:complete